MTTIEAVAIFKILQDKYASPHLIDSEIVRMLNMAQYERLNRLIPDDLGGVVNFEQDQNVALNLKPFIYLLSGLFPRNPDCMITDVSINEELVDMVIPSDSEPDAKYFRICNVIKIGDVSYYCKYVKHNNFFRSSLNVFKSPDSIFQYTLNAEGIQIYPVTQDTYTQPFGITVIKHPKKMKLPEGYDEAVDPEWDDYNMNLIIMIALQLAGISTRDEELITDIRNTKITN
jgi:hypothetical protein